MLQFMGGRIILTAIASRQNDTVLLIVLVSLVLASGLMVPWGDSERAQHRNRQPSLNDWTEAYRVHDTEVYA